MQAKLRTVDCIVEVHDSRIPISGRNPTFYQNFIGNKPHLLVMNKCDMISGRDIRKIKNYYSQGPELLFTNCKNDQDQGMKKVTCSSLYTPFLNTNLLLIIDDSLHF